MLRQQFTLYLQIDMNAQDYTGSQMKTAGEELQARNLHRMSGVLEAHKRTSLAERESEIAKHTEFLRMGERSDHTVCSLNFVRNGEGCYVALRVMAPRCEEQEHGMALTPVASRRDTLKNSPIFPRVS